VCKPGLQGSKGGNIQGNPEVYAGLGSSYSTDHHQERGSGGVGFVELRRQGQHLKGGKKGGSEGG